MPSTTRTQDRLLASIRKAKGAADSPAVAPAEPASAAPDTPSPEPVSAPRPRARRSPAPAPAESLPPAVTPAPVDAYQRFPRIWPD